MYVFHVSVGLLGIGHFNRRMSSSSVRHAGCSRAEGSRAEGSRGHVEERLGDGGT
jgi:hypothetical protein